MTQFGDVIMTRYDDSATLECRVVVTTADPIVLVSDELLENADPALVARDGDLLTFGTDGEGCGRVTYRLGERHDMHSLVMRRVDKP